MENMKKTEKKSIVVNCEICDTRKVSESWFDVFERVVINAETLIVSDRSKDVLNKSQSVLNVESTLDLSEDVNIMIQNGDFTIAAGEYQDDGEEKALIVKGNLIIETGSEQILKQYALVFATGNVMYPKSMALYMTNIKTNGKMKVVPDGAIFLKENAVLDKYFQMRARQNAKYYAGKSVVMTDPNLSMTVLNDKNVQFVTPKVLITENYIEEALPLFSETTEICELPEGCQYVEGNRMLDNDLVEQYGNRLYVRGNLSLQAESTPYLKNMEYIQTSGTVSLLKEQVSIWNSKFFKCKNMKIVKGRIIKNNKKVMLTKEMLDASPEGLLLEDIIEVVVDKNVSPEEILDKVSITNCIKVCCYQEQRSAVELVSKNLVKIAVVDGKAQDEDIKEKKETEGIPEFLQEISEIMPSSQSQTTVINAEYYVL